MTDPMDEYHTTYGYVGNDPIANLDPNGESTARFDGRTNRIHIFGNDGKYKFSLDAHNQTGKSKMLEDGVYKVWTKKVAWKDPNKKVDSKYLKDFGEKISPYDTKGAYGEEGTIVLEDYTNSYGKFGSGYALHAGRSYIESFVERVTAGCIRLASDVAMRQLTSLMAYDPLESVSVFGNRAPNMNNVQRDWYDPVKLEGGSAVVEVTAKKL